MWVTFFLSILFSAQVFAFEPASFEAISTRSEFSGSGHASECRDVLLGGIYDIYSSAQSSYHYRLIQDYVCSESKSGGGTSAGIKVIFENIPFGGNYSKNKEHWEKVCRDYKSEYTDDERQYLMIQQINPNVLKAWSDCMKQRTNSLYCWGRSDPDQRIVVHVEYPFGNPPLTVEGPIILSNLNFIADQSLTTINPGERILAFTKQDPLQSSLFVLNASNSYNQVACTVGIPKPEPKVRPLWCAKIYAEVNYQGTEFTFQVNNDGSAHNVNDLNRYDLSRKVSSVRVHPGCTFKGYEDPLLLGKRFHTTSSIPDFNVTGWNDFIQSAKCYCPLN
jgi:hypothetical protein